VASAYFPSEEQQPPPPELAALVEYCLKNNIHIIIGCDANAHHKEWVSSDTNDKGECLLEFIINNKLEIINKGRVATYRHEGLDREEVIDLTLSSHFIKSKIKDWQVSSEPSLTDQRHICFNIEVEKRCTTPTGIIKNISWKRYQRLLRASKTDFTIEKINNSTDMDKAAKKLNSVILAVYEASCPITYRKVKKDVPWLEKELENLRKKVRRLENKKRERATSKATLTTYNKAIRRLKRKSFVRFNEEIVDSSCGCTKEDT
jgi:Endonuclease-reverse transcriptase